MMAPPNQMQFNPESPEHKIALESRFYTGWWRMTTGTPGEVIYQSYRCPDHRDWYDCMTWPTWWQALASALAAAERAPNTTYEGMHGHGLA